MKRLGLLAGLAACGGAGGITIDEPMAAVQIANPNCQIIPPNMADITVEGLFTLAEGDAVSADFTLVAPAIDSNGFFNCGSWQELFDPGGQSVGCLRDPSAPLSMQAVNINRNVTVSGNLQDPSPVVIKLKVTDGRGGAELASANMMVTCSSLN